MTRLLLRPTAATTGVTIPGGNLLVPTGITFVGSSPWLDEGTDSYLAWPASAFATFGESSGVRLTFPAFSTAGLMAINYRCVVQGLPDTGEDIPPNVMFESDIGAGFGEANYLGGAQLYDTAGVSQLPSGYFHFLGRVEDDWTTGIAALVDTRWQFNNTIDINPASGVYAAVWFNGGNFSYNGPLKIAEFALELLYEGDSGESGSMYSDAGKPFLAVCGWEANVALSDDTGKAAVTSALLGAWGFTNTNAIGVVGWKDGRIGWANDSFPIIISTPGQTAIAALGDVSSSGHDYSGPNAGGAFSVFADRKNNTALVQYSYYDADVDAVDLHFFLAEFSSTGALKGHWDMGKEDGPGGWYRGAEYGCVTDDGKLYLLTYSTNGGGGDHFGERLQVFDRSSPGDMTDITASSEVFDFIDANSEFACGIDTDGTNLFIAVSDEPATDLLAGYYPCEVQIFVQAPSGEILSRHRFYFPPNEGYAFRVGGIAVVDSTVYIQAIWLGMEFGTATGNNEYDGVMKIELDLDSAYTETALNLTTHGFYGQFRFGIEGYIGPCLKTGIAPLRHNQRDDGAGVNEGHARMYGRQGEKGNAASSLQFGKRIVARRENGNGYA